MKILLLKSLYATIGEKFLSLCRRNKSWTLIAEIPLKKSCHYPRLDFRRPLGLIPRTAAGNRAYHYPSPSALHSGQTQNSTPLPVSLPRSKRVRLFPVPCLSVKSWRSIVEFEGSPSWCIFLRAKCLWVGALGANRLGVVEWIKYFFPIFPPPALPQPMYSPKFLLAFRNQDGECMVLLFLFVHDFSILELWGSALLQVNL